MEGEGEETHISLRVFKCLLLAVWHDIEEKNGTEGP